VRIPPTGSDRPHFDLSADLHGHAVDYANDADRSWFVAHPSAVAYVRPALDHEWCCPLCVADGRGCRSPAGRVVAVRVQAIGRGMRVRSPVVVGDGGCSHSADLARAPASLAVGLDGKRWGRSHPRPPRVLWGPQRTQSGKL
jgi:hypothetical protein